MQTFNKAKNALSKIIFKRLKTSRYTFIILILLLVAGLFFPGLSFISNKRIEGKVVRISDGDTITILVDGNKQERIRLHGIDCPESNQDFGQVAKKFTSDLCFGQRVAVEVRDVDRYGRIVGVVYNTDNVNVNLALLENGLAWHYTAYDQSLAFSAAEKKARLNKQGLWSHKDAIAPWEFRKRKK